MTEKKKYEKPSMEVLECEQEVQLLAGSPAPTSASIDDYEDGEFSW